MRGDRSVVAVVVLSFCVVAQHPVPGGEGQPATLAKTPAAPWPEQEAKALSLLFAQRQRLLTDPAARREPSLGKVWTMGSDSCAVFAADADGDVVMPRELAAGQQFCIACWPRSFQGGHRRALLLHSDGPVLVCDVEGDQPDPLTANAIVARGSNGRF